MSMDPAIYKHFEANRVQASISTDNHLRVYECLEQPSLTTWQPSEEIDILTLPSTSSPSSVSLAFATPTQTSATLEGASASLVAQALQQSQSQTGVQIRPGMGNREADGGWCLSWCKDRYWGEVIATGCGIGGTVKVLFSPAFTLSDLFINFWIYR
jgi:nucleoporin SEH1